MTHSLLYAQATEMLSQAVQVALNCGDYVLAANAALEMVETVAQYDCNVTTQYLALYQVYHPPDWLKFLLNRS